MKQKFLMLLICTAVLPLAIFSSRVMAEGTPQYIEDGNIRVRFYFDRNFYDNYLWRYDDLIGDLVDAMNYTGRYRLGIKFTYQPQSNNIVDIGDISDTYDLRDFMQDNLGTQSAVLKVLVHHNLIGVCEFDYSSFAVGTYYGNTNLMWITTNPGCNSSGIRAQAEVKETFIHELGHALWHPGLGGSVCRQARVPIMCEGGIGNRIAGRDWTWWRSYEISHIRKGVFGNTKPQYPVVDCYEYSGYSACSNDCANWRCTFDYNDPGAYEACYQSCMNTRCNNICN